MNPFVKLFFILYSLILTYGYINDIPYGTKIKTYPITNLFTYIPIFNNITYVWYNKNLLLIELNKVKILLKLITGVKETITKLFLFLVKS
jgi:hypothetical protein